jgi:hypothetical protein
MNNFKKYLCYDIFHIIESYLPDRKLVDGCLLTYNLIDKTFFTNIYSFDDYVKICENKFENSCAALTKYYIDNSKDKKARRKLIDMILSKSNYYDNQLEMIEYSRFSDFKYVVKLFIKNCLPLKFLFDLQNFAIKQNVNNMLMLTKKKKEKYNRFLIKFIKWRTKLIEKNVIIASKYYDNNFTFLFNPFDYIEGIGTLKTFKNRFKEFSLGICDEHKIFDDEVISGGSIVGCLLGENLHKYEESDIDIYVLNTQENCNIKVFNLIKNTYEYAKYIYAEKCNISMDVIAAYLINITVELPLLKKKRIFQIILTECKTPYDIIEEFDFNITKNFYYKEELYSTMDAINELKDRTIKYMDLSKKFYNHFLSHDFERLNKYKNRFLLSNNMKNKFDKLTNDKYYIELKEDVKNSINNRKKYHYHDNDIKNMIKSRPNFINNIFNNMKWKCPDDHVIKMFLLTVNNKYSVDDEDSSPTTCVSINVEIIVKRKPNLFDELCILEGDINPIFNYYVDDTCCKLRFGRNFEILHGKFSDSSIIDKKIYIKNIILKYSNVNDTFKIYGNRLI